MRAMIRLDDLLACGGHVHGTPHTTTFADFSYDSRLTQPGELFLALRTPRADGHDYIAAALAAGASGVICTWPPASAEGATVIVADDPAALARRWASRRLRAVAPQVVAVTGSVGKTSTVRVIAALLGQVGPTFRSRQSFNSLLGLPIAIARLRDEHRFAVLEFGADRFGEIARLAELFPPQVAVVTSIAAAHLDAFGTLDGVAREKGALVEALPAAGWAVLNADDPRAAALRERTSAHVLLYGRDAACDLRAVNIRLGLDGTRFRILWNGRGAPSPLGTSELEAFVPLVGEPAVLAGLAAVGAALVCGATLDQSARALAQVDPPAGRLRPLPARGGATLLDDSYHASPAAMLAALQALAALPARRRIALLGDPGGGDLATHQAIGQAAGTLADLLICKGDWGIAATRAAARAHSAVEHAVVYTAAEAFAALPTDLGPGDLVLVKGSAEARMERVVAALLADSSAATRYLVRQQPAWHSERAGAPDRPTWVRIDLDAIANNVRRLCAIAGVPLMITIKADAYGHSGARDT